jgi:hypothetical protein
MIRKEVENKCVKPNQQPNPEKLIQEKNIFLLPANCQRHLWTKTFQ